MPHNARYIECPIYIFIFTTNCSTILSRCTMTSLLSSNSFFPVDSESTSQFKDQIFRSNRAKQVKSSLKQTERVLEKVSLKLSFVALLSKGEYFSIRGQNSTG